MDWIEWIIVVIAVVEVSLVVDGVDGPLVNCAWCVSLALGKSEILDFV